MNSPIHAYRVWLNSFASVQVDPVEIVALDRAAQVAEVRLVAGWRPRAVPFAELASTPERVAEKVRALLSPLPTAAPAEKSAPFKMAGAGAVANS